MSGPTQPFSIQLHQRKYCSEGEDFRGYANRWATALKDDDAHWEAIREIALDQRFLPAGRVQAAVGSLRRVTPHNCFVSGTIQDNFVGHDGIMARATEAAQTMRMGGGVGTDFSTLRPRGDLIATLQSRSSGPVSFIGIWDAVGVTTSSTDHRRGAQMGVLRVDHPDIEEFIQVKCRKGALTGFNLSVGITTAFMTRVANDTDFNLVWKGRVYKTVRARDLWEKIMRATWDWADPGVLFIDTINNMNNLWYCEKIAASNPCGEQPLPPYGACLLGSFNLVKYIDHISSSPDGPYGEDDPQWWFNWEQFKKDIPPIVRAMDNVIDHATYPLDQQRDEAISKRRMGLGITGLANAGEVLGFEYGSPGFINFTKHVLRTLRDRAYTASVVLATEKGAFPLFDADKYLEGAGIKKLPMALQDLIRQHGIRNSHLISVAPTGTISLVADNVSSGLEPVFAYRTDREVQGFDGSESVVLEDYGHRVWNVKGKRSKDCSVDDHLEVLIAASEFVDSAVSKTCNVGSEVTWEQFKEIYVTAWERGCKGCTTFRAEGKRGSMMQEDDAPVCEINLETGERDCG